MLDSTRENYTWTETASNDTINSWMGAVVRMHKDGVLKDPNDFDSPGTAPHGQEFLRGTTYLNLVQFIKLNKVHPKLAELWLRTTENRKAASSINGVLGDDLKHLLENQEGVRITSQEFDRVIALHGAHPEEIRARICGYWKKGRCKQEASCPFTHG